MNDPPPQDTGAILEVGAMSITRRLTEAGHRALWAGGCVRDRLLGRTPKDIDIATDATPDRVLELFPEALDIGKSFGVMVVPIEGRPFEVATFRKDEGIADGRHPKRVRFSDEREDALRRDFTINAMFFDPETRELLDYAGGQADVQRRIVRAVGDPETRFREDRLRMLRAVRFASTLDFDLDPETASTIRLQAADIARVSFERVYAELTRWLTESPRAGRGLRLLRETGLLAVLLPEVAALDGVEQPPEFHPEGDVFTHTAMMLDALPDAPEPELAWSVLLHDIGKPPTAEWSAGSRGEARWRFNEHDQVGADLAARILRRLKAPAHMLAVVEHCVRNHMRFGDVRRMRESTLRRMVGHPLFPLELELHRLDCQSSHQNLEHVTFLRDTLERLRAEPILPPPRVRGEDLLALGIPEGPAVGRWLKAAYDRQLEHPKMDRESLLEWMDRSLSESRAGSPTAPPEETP